eukprot:Hpha_TRINITY_DN21501_c0_g1::TRINITY_DN21501_c0_g1_i1::g.34::m.34
MEWYASFVPRPPSDAPRTVAQRLQLAAARGDLGTVRELVTTEAKPPHPGWVLSLRRASKVGDIGLTEALLVPLSPRQAGEEGEVCDALEDALEEAACCAVQSDTTPILEAVLSRSRRLPLSLALEVACTLRKVEHMCLIMQLGGL